MDYTSQFLFTPGVERVRYYQYQKDHNNIFLTPSCYKIATETDSFWFFDIIVAYQHHPLLKTEEVQSWVFRKTDNSVWKAVCEDCYETTLVMQEISAVDFPLQAINFCVVDRVCMLLSELNSTYFFPEY